MKPAAVPLHLATTIALVSNVIGKRCVFVVLLLDRTRHGKRRLHERHAIKRVQPADELLLVRFVEHSGRVGRFPKPFAETRHDFADRPFVQIVFAGIGHRLFEQARRRCIRLGYTLLKRRCIGRCGQIIRTLRLLTVASGDQKRRECH